MFRNLATYYSCAKPNGDNSNTKGLRITSKIGGGFGRADIDPLDYRVDQVEDDQGNTPYASYTEFSEALWEMQMNNFDCVDLDPNKVEFEGRLHSIHNYHDLNEREAQQYFYHPDHLGSSSFITDAAGEVEQFLQYLPYGEDFIDQRAGWNTRYTFSAKEKDEKTGYHYFGARYYDSERSQWLSVDPMASGFPGISPYAYTHNNPFVDPWGLLATKYKKTGETIKIDDEHDETVIISDKEEWE